MEYKIERKAQSEGGSFGKRLILVSVGSLALILGTIAAAGAALGDMGRYSEVFGEVAFVPILIMFVFLTVGILLFVSGRNEKKRKAEAKDHLQTVVGRIDDISLTVYRGVEKTRRRYYVYVNYSYNGVDYNHVSYPYHNSGMSKGDYIELTIDPRKPGQIARRDGSGLLTIMGVLFVFSSLMTLAMCVGMMYML